VNGLNYLSIRIFRLAGLAAANGLSRLGLKVQILERSPFLEPRGSTLLVAPNGLKALQEIFPEIASNIVCQGRHIRISAPDTSIKHENYSARLYHSHSSEERGAPNTTGLSFTLPWWIARDILLQHVPSNVSIVLGCKVESIHYDSDGNEGKSTRVIVKSSNGEIFKSKLLVAADGVSSSIRKIMNMPGPISLSLKYTHGNFIASDEDYLKLRILSGNEDGELLAMESSDEKHILVCSFFMNNRICWTLRELLPLDSASASITERLKSFPRDFIGELFRLTPADALHTTDPLRYVPLPVSYYTDQLKRCGYDELALQYEEEKRTLGREPEDEVGYGGQRRVCFIGDSAHAMPPFAGQGGNMAYEDALQLCRDIKRMSSGTNPSRVTATTDPPEEANANRVGEQEETTPSFAFLEDEDQTDHFIKAFERRRLRRVRLIHEDQMARVANRSIPFWPPIFRKWVVDGI